MIDLNALLSKAKEILEREKKKRENTLLARMHRGENVLLSDKYANIGKNLQQFPDTSLTLPTLPWKKNDKESPLIPVTKFITGLPGDIVRSYGKSLETLSTKEGQENVKKGVTSLPSQVKNKDVLGLIENPAVQTGLDVTDFLPGGLVFGLGTKAMLREGGEKVAKQTLEKTAKEGIEQSAKRSAEKEGLEQMKRLFNYENELRKLGYTSDEAAKIGYSEADNIIKEGITPNQYRKAIPSIETTKQAADIADIKVSAGDITKKGFKGLDPEVQNAYKTWVNERAASKVKSLSTKTNFKDLDNKGIEGLFDFQAGAKEGRFKDLRDFFDQRYKDIKDAGLDVNYKQNYLTQIWANPEDEIAKVFDRRLTTNPSFTVEQVIEDYRHGINAGLTPRFENLSEVAGWYERRVQKAIADKKFFNYLANDSLIMPGNKAPLGWISLDPDRFPKYLTKLDNGKYVGVYKAPPELGELINNYLRGGSDTLLSKVANYASEIKNVVLSAGIPKTALNFHGVNILMRHTLASDNPITAFAKGLYYLARPSAAQKSVDLELAERAVRNGLTLSTEDHAMQIVERGMKKGIFDNLKEKGISAVKFFGGEKELFEGVIPALKTSQYETIYDDLIKRGIDEKEAGQTAAKIVNNIYGGINIEEFGRSKDLQNFLRSSILAPDWAESNVRMAGGIIKGVFKPGSPEYKAYRTFLRNLILVYSGANVINKLKSDHYMWENDPGHTFEIELGKTKEGKKRFIRPFGTAVDFVRIPYDVALSLAKGDPSSIFRVIRNRMSVPSSVALALLANVDYRGNPIYGRDRFGNPLTFGQSIGGIGGELTRLGTPPQVKAGIDVSTDRIGAEEFFAQLIEAPVRYQNIYLSKAEKKYNEYKDLREKDPEAAKDMARKIYAEDPYLYSRMKRVAKDERLNVTDEEKKIRNLGVADGERAKAVWKKLQELEPGSPERRAFVQDYMNKSIITDQVYIQLKKMKQGEFDKAKTSMNIFSLLNFAQ